MVALSWGDYRPDVSDLNADFTRALRNALPRGDGYGPWKDVEPFTDALPGTCRGYYVARKDDGSVAIFAGTETNLYLLNNTTLAWTEVSKGGSDYTSLSADAHWVFAQFQDIVIATQKNDVIQYYDLGSSSEFDDLAGSPPQAGWVAVVGPFLVAADLLSAPYDIQWSGLNDVTEWTPGTAYSSSQPFPDGGRVRCVIEMGGGVGLAIQEQAVRRMVWSPGSAEIFQIERLPNVPGILAPYSLCATVGGAYYVSTRGFVRVAPDGGFTPIGEEKVDRTFLGQHDASVQGAIRELAYDSEQPQLVVGAVDPERNVVFWAYKSQGGQAGLMDRGLAYHISLQKWGPVEIDLEYLAPLFQPGLTLEALDAIAPGAQTISNAVNNGSGLVRLTVGSTSGWTTGDYKTISAVGGVSAANGTWAITVVNGTTIDLQGTSFSGTYTSGGIVGGSVDDLPFSLDEVSTATLPSLSGVTADHKVGFFSGDTLETELETSEQRGERRRFLVNGMWPATDAATVYGRVVSRVQINGEPTEGTENAMDSDGFIPLLGEGRSVRGRNRIPAGTVWTFSTGVEAEVMQGGER